MKQVPRRTSATALRGKSAKADGSQPLEAEAGSTGATGAVTAPAPE